MATLSAVAPDGATLNIDVPPGTDPATYGNMVDDAVSHYTANQQTPIESVESFGRGALRNFPGAQQAVAMAAPELNKIGLADEPTYSGEISHLTNAAEQAKAQNKGAYDAGAIFGTALPLAIPGAGEALGAAGPLADVLEGASGSGIIGGALNGAAQSLSDTNLTKPGAQDIKNAGSSAVMGGVLGGAGSWIGNHFPTADSLEARAAKSAGSLGDYTTQEAINLPSKYRNELAQNQLPKDMGGVQRLLGKNLNDELEKAGTPIRAGDTNQDVLDKAENALSGLGKQQAAIISSLDSNPVAAGQAQAVAHEAMGKFQTDAAEKWALPGQKKVPFMDLKPRPLARTELAQAKRINAEFMILRDDPSFGAAQSLKQMLDSKISNFFKAVVPGHSQQPLMDARTALRNAMTDAAPPELADILHKEGKLYDVIEPIQRKAAAIGATGGKNAMMSYYSNPVALAAFGLGHLAGGWIPGMVAGVGTASVMKNHGPQMATAMANSPLTKKIVTGLPPLTNAARLELMNYLASKHGQQQ